jgi:hypothetical protein
MAIRRRRRPASQIHFSFDSFLDLVANVVGIILRLILVAWAGARAYQGLPVSVDLPELPETRQIAKTKEFDDQSQKVQIKNDALQDQVARLESQLASILDKSKLLERESEEQKKREVLVDKDMEGLAHERDKQAAVTRVVDEPLFAANRLELEKEAKDIAEKIQELKKVPTVKKIHTWKTPISQTLQTDELIFECRNGKVTGIDLAVMVEEIQSGMKEKGELLRNQWQIEETTKPYGPFRLRYTIEREKNALEEVGGGRPNDFGGFRYGLMAWELIPIDPNRGETLEESLKPGSRFRSIIDRLDNGQTAITFCVYPDSFAIYRALRDHLHEKDIVVAGRPLPMEAPIAMDAKKGTASRGQ